MVSDIELLEIEIETLWVTDSRRRLVCTRTPDRRTAPQMVIGTCADGHVVRFGHEVPDALAAELYAEIATGASPTDQATSPTALDRCEELLEGVIGVVERSAGPSYLVPATIVHTSSAAIERSGGKNIEALRLRNPGTWTTQEWGLLLDGVLGPWAMATDDGRVISICHTARLGDRGAEAGVWTDARFRGQGHASAVTAAWASLLAASRRPLFYSTEGSNLSSQRVAARLGLRSIGWTWRLAQPQPS